MTGDGGRKGSTVFASSGRACLCPPTAPWSPRRVGLTSPGVLTRSFEFTSLVAFFLLPCLTGRCGVLPLSCLPPPAPPPSPRASSSSASSITSLGVSAPVEGEVYHIDVLSEFGTKGKGLLDFGNVQVGQSAELPITLFNKGKFPVRYGFR